MGQLAVSIAHELNQPLTAVVTHAYACKEWLNSNPARLEKVSATADKIIQESTRASEVVKRVRALFRKDVQAREQVDVNQLIRKLVRVLRSEAIRRGVTVQLALASDLPRAQIDPVQVQQVLLNLANNAMDAMAQVSGSRELTIRSSRQKDGEILIAVEDQGPGIPLEIGNKIFEPFFTTKPEGTGMGLAICRSIVEAHDGRLWAANSLTRGAIFQFTLPTKA